MPVILEKIDIIKTMNNIIVLTSFSILFAINGGDTLFGRVIIKLKEMALALIVNH